MPALDIPYRDKREHSITNFIPQCVIDTDCRGLLRLPSGDDAEGAVAVTEVNRIALTICKHLNLNVPRALKNFSMYTTGEPKAACASDCVT